MKALKLLILGCVGLAVAAPAWAQQTPTPGSPGPWGYPHMMWGGGWGWHPGMIFGPFFMLLMLVGVVVLVAWLVRGPAYHGFHRHHGSGWCPHCGRGDQGHEALNILEQRFARGEIEKAEFEEKRRLLSR